MKKIQLHIQEPCHENWEGMTEQDKGRFCGSCQKTVVDFTNMSDRQLAEFFKKPVGSVCGRFYNDQLQRDIPIPRKRIPWIKYFFTITWPAFVLLLKSCTNNNSTVGKVQVKLEKPRTEKQATEAAVIEKAVRKQTTIGASVMEETATEKAVEDTSIPPPPPVVGNINVQMDIKNESYVVVPLISIPVKNKNYLMGYTTSNLSGQKKDTVVKPEADTIAEAKTFMEPVTVTAYPLKRVISIMGAVSRVSECSMEIRKDSSTTNMLLIPDQAINKAVIFPNPVRSGGELSVRLPHAVKGQVQLFTISGQLVLSRAISNEKDNLVRLIVPEVSPGMYIVAVSDKAGGQSFSEKILIQ